MEDINSVPGAKTGPDIIPQSETTVVATIESAGTPPASTYADMEGSVPAEVQESAGVPAAENAAEEVEEPDLAALIEELAAMDRFKYLLNRKKYAAQLEVGLGALDKIVYNRQKELAREARTAAPTGAYVLRDDGVWARLDEGLPPVKICSPIEVVARGRTKDGTGHMSLVNVTDPDGVIHQWQMPWEMLGGDGSEVFKKLYNLGAKVSTEPAARRALIDYLNKSDPQSIYRTVSQTGWVEGCYVLPGVTIPSDSEEQFLYDGTVDSPEDYAVSGTLEDWIENIGTLCSGNPVLLLSVSMAFSAPLQFFTGIESGFINIQGKSSSGKTTALKAAASVNGGRSRIKRWRATSNGLEGVAEAHNDSQLCIDELGQLSPKEAGDVAYMLANGSGKQRARTDGSSKRVRSWRLSGLSSGEISLATLMGESGKVARTGQEIRFIDLRLGLTGENGIIENLHGRESSAALVMELDRKSKKIYGAPMRIFLEAITGIPADSLANKVKAAIEDFVKEVLPDTADNGQVQRVAMRFGLIAAGGEFASELALTGWKKGEATEAVANLFRLWLAQRESEGPSEKDRILAQVRLFFEKYGTSRFYKLNPAESAGYPEREITNCAGYMKIDGEGSVHLVFREVFKTEVCEGYEPRDVCKVLAEAGILQLDSKGGYTVPKKDPRTPGHTNRFYVIKNAIGLYVDPKEQAEHEAYMEELAAEAKTEMDSLLPGNVKSEA